MNPSPDTAALSLKRACGAEGSSKCPHTASPTWSLQAAFLPSTLIARNFLSLRCGLRTAAEVHHPRSITTFPSTRPSFPAASSPARSGGAGPPGRGKRTLSGAAGAAGSARSGGECGRAGRRGRAGESTQGRSGAAGAAAAVPGRATEGGSAV